MKQPPHVSTFHHQQCILKLNTGKKFHILLHRISYIENLYRIDIKENTKIRLTLIVKGELQHLPFRSNQVLH